MLQHSEAFTTVFLNVSFYMREIGDINKVFAKTSICILSVKL